MKFLLSLTLLLSCLYGIQCWRLPQPAHAQTAQQTCRYGWKTTCRTDSGGHTICTTRCR